MKKYKVYGTIKVEIEFSEYLDSSNEKSAISKAEKLIYKKLGITKFNVTDEEIYCDEIK